MLLDECKAASIEIRTQADVTNINQTDDHYNIEIGEISITTSSLVIATGALSIPTLGGSAFGYKIADQFHLPTIPTRAGLVPLTFSDEIKGVCERLSGISVTAAVSVADSVAGGRHPTFTEQLLFTHRGMSGPAILQISNYWTQGNELYVDLLPEIDASAFILTAKKSRGASLLRTVISEKLPRSLVMELQALYWPEFADRPLAEITDLELNRIGKQLNRWTLKPSGTEGYRTAEVTLGGVNSDYLNAKTFASKQNSSLFFIGEVVDVAGHLGGFNFQWAWSSGYCAGLAA
jgi:predicted Rossmann fold flavoprotein